MESVFSLPQITYDPIASDLPIFASINYEKGNERKKNKKTFLHSLTAQVFGKWLTSGLPLLTVPVTLIVVLQYKCSAGAAISQILLLYARGIISLHNSCH